MTVYLVRHGQDDDTVRGGWSMSPLTDEGRAQAERLAEAIVSEREKYNICRIYSSDLPRAVQTARPTAARLGLQIIERREFRETDNGVLAGMKNELAKANFPGVFWNTLGWEQRYPGGESPREFYERIRTAWLRLQKELRQTGGNAMLFTHAGVINVILCLCEGREFTNKQRGRSISHTEVVAVEI